MPHEPTGEKREQPYTEEDLLREAEEDRQKELAAAHTISRERLEKLEGNALVTNFFNNFHGHLPGGYKRPLEKQLHKDVDAVIERLGLDKEEILKWQKNRPPTPEEKEKMLNVMKAIYVEMRKLGYSHYPDLSG